MFRTFTGSRIIVAVSLLLVWTAMVMSSGSMAPARPLAAAAIAPPDCSGIETYRQQLGTIRDDYRAAFLEQLPGVQPDWEITGGVDLELAALESGEDYGLAWAGWLTERSNIELKTLAKLWSERASQLRALQPPLVAQDFHNGLIAGAALLARFYQQSASMGWMMAVVFTMLGGDDGSPSLADLNDELVASCPAWAAYQTEAGATPTPS